MALFKKKEKISEPAPAPAPTVKQETYDFIVKCDNEKSEKTLIKYQKFWTEDEDKYNGMSLKEFKAEGDPGDKVYQYPPLDVDVKLDAFLGEDGSVTITAYVLSGSDDEIRVGTAAQTKAKKILRILQDNSPKISGELYGGKYWKMEDSGYVNADWSEELTVRVFLTYEV